MIISQRGVLPPVNFAELDASLQSSILGPAGARLITAVDLASTFTEGQNGGVVTLTVGNTDIVSLGALTFTLGQLVLFYGQANTTKGATAGATQLEVFFTAGTGIIQTLGGQFAIAVIHPAVPIGNTYQGLVAGFARCTTAGTVTPRLRGQSFGSDSSITAGSGRFGIFAF